MAITFLGAAASASSNADADLTLATTVSVGQMIVTISVANATAPSSLMSDSKGNTYTERDVFAQGGAGMRISFSDCTVGTQLVASDVISCESGGVRNQGFYAWAVDTTGFDGTYGSANSEGRGNGTAVSSNLQNLITTNADDYLMGVIGTRVPSTLSGVTAGWNAEATPSVTTSDADVRLFGFSQTVAAATTYPFSGTLGSAADWESLAVGYKQVPAPNLGATHLLMPLGHG